VVPFVGSTRIDPYVGEDESHFTQKPGKTRDFLRRLLRRRGWFAVWSGPYCWRAIRMELSARRVSTQTRGRRGHESHFSQEAGDGGQRLLTSSPTRRETVHPCSSEFIRFHLWCRSSAPFLLLGNATVAVAALRVSRSTPPESMGWERGLHASFLPLSRESLGTRSGHRRFNAPELSHPRIECELG